MEKESLEKKLDDALNFIDYNKEMYYPKPSSITTPFAENLMKSLKLDESEFCELLNILFEDGYIDLEFPRGKDNPSMFCTKIKLKGKYFISQGGYVGKLEYKNQEVDRIHKLESENRAIQYNNLVLTKILTWTGIAVGIISLLQYLLSVKSKYPHFPSWYYLFH